MSPHPIGAKCIWFTGLSGAGKTTIATLLVDRLRLSGIHTYLVDADVVREGLNADLGFCSLDRIENVRRISYLAATLVDADVHAIVTSISPYAECRNKARAIFPTGGFVEVYVATPFSVCADRDTKGLYDRAKRGELTRLTGWDEPYEAPACPEIFIDTAELSARDAADKVFDFLDRNSIR
jgi:bifunctional enzyme CysN/CysC